MGIMFNKPMFYSILAGLCLMSECYSVTKNNSMCYVQNENTTEGYYEISELLQSVFLGGDRAEISITVDPTVKKTTLLVQRIHRRAKIRPKKTVINIFVKDSVLYINEKNKYSFSSETLELFMKFSSIELIKYELITPHAVSFEAKTRELKLISTSDLKDVRVQGCTVLALSGNINSLKIES